LIRVEPGSDQAVSAMRRHRPITAMACAALVLAGTATARAATTTHLDAAGWRALAAMNAVTKPTVSTCNGLSHGSTEEQARGVAGICLDTAEVSLWSQHAAGDCRSPATEGRCGTDYTGLVNDLNAGAAWARWFTGQLGSGGCRSFFASIGQSDAALARAAAPFAADLRAHRRGAGPLADLQRMVQQANALEQQSQQRSGTLALDMGACKPPA
jgi:hypothetical protein